MKHSIRNSLVLIGILILLGAGSWIYFNYVTEPQLAEARETLKTRKQNLAEINATIEQFDMLRQKHFEISEAIKNYPKDLFPSDAQSVVYGFINALSTGQAYIDYNLKYIRTDVHGHYGVVRTSLIGSGYFTYLYRFISAIENSAPLTKITALQISSLDSPELLGKVDVRMEIESYFYRTDGDSLKPREWVNKDVASLYASADKQGKVVDLIKRGHPVTMLEMEDAWAQVYADNGTGWIQTVDLAADPNAVDLVKFNQSAAVQHNPFYPHIHSIPQNRNNLVDVSKSRLIGLTSNQAYVIDQSGQMQQLSRGDDVYLGTLVSINQKQQYAIFRLNRGGIRERVTMHVESKN